MWFFFHFAYLFLDSADKTISVFLFAWYSNNKICLCQIVSLDVKFVIQQTLSFFVLLLILLFDLHLYIFVRWTCREQVARNNRNDRWMWFAEVTRRLKYNNEDWVTCYVWYIARLHILAISISTRMLIGPEKRQQQIWYWNRYQGFFTHTK